MILLDTHIWVNWILKGDVALSPAWHLEALTETEQRRKEGKIDSLILYAGMHAKFHDYHRLLSKRFPYAVSLEP